jgi:hypothetical protein
LLFSKRHLLGERPAFLSMFLIVVNVLHQQPQSVRSVGAYRAWRHTVNFYMKLMVNIALLNHQREGHPHKDCSSLTAHAGHEGPVVAVRKRIPRGIVNLTT